MSRECLRFGTALRPRGRPEPWAAFQRRAASAYRQLRELHERLKVQFDKLGDAGRSIGSRVGAYLVELRQQINANNNIARAGKDPNTEALTSAEEQARRARVRRARDAAARRC